VVDNGGDLVVSGLRRRHDGAQHDAVVSKTWLVSSTSSWSETEAQLETVGATGSFGRALACRSTTQKGKTRVSRGALGSGEGG
jgi:hypothetical protein